MHNIIRKLRKEKGLTQQQVADHLHLDRSTYAYYESGRSKLNADIIVKLAHFYQVRSLGRSLYRKRKKKRTHKRECANCLRALARWCR